MSAWLFMMATLVLGVQGGLLQYDLTHGQQQGLIFFTGGAAVGLDLLGGARPCRTRDSSGSPSRHCMRSGPRGRGARTASPPLTTLGWLRGELDP